MNYSQLKADLIARSFTSDGDPVAAAAAMNAVTVEQPSGLPLNKRTLVHLLELPTATTVMTALTGAAANGMTLGETSYPAAMFQLLLDLVNNLGTPGDPGGIETADPQYTQFVGLFEAAGVLTADQATTLTAYATIVTPYPKTIGWSGPITDGDVQTAWSM